MSTDRQMAICTWFVGDRPGEETHFPQVQGLVSSSAEFQEIYWRCIVVFFATSKQRNPNYRHVLFANCPAPVVDGIDIGSILMKYGVEIIFLPISYRIPPGKFGSFGNQFYILDIIKFVARSAISRIVVLDSDCVWLRSADALGHAIDSVGILAYDLGLPASQIENGIAVGNLPTLGSALGFPARRTPSVYAGGEVFAATREACRNLVPMIERLWLNNLRALALGEPSLNEEAQFLSVLYLHCGIRMDTANAFLRRIWTTFRHRDSRPSDLDLTIWHLPAEKKTGFSNLYPIVLDSNSPFWGAGEISNRALLAQSFGIPRRSARKLVIDLAVKLAEKGRIRSSRGPKLKS
jgi:hypothetical protein